MKFYLDLDENELRMLRLVLYNQAAFFTWQDLKQVKEKLDRFQEIARKVTTE